MTSSIIKAQDDSLKENFSFTGKEKKIPSGIQIKADAMEILLLKTYVQSVFANENILNRTVPN